MDVLRRRGVDGLELDPCAAVLARSTRPRMSDLVVPEGDLDVDARHGIFGHAQHGRNGVVERPLDGRSLGPRLRKGGERDVDAGHGVIVDLPDEYSGLGG